MELKVPFTDVTFDTVRPIYAEIERLVVSAFEELSVDYLEYVNTEPNAKREQLLKEFDVYCSLKTNSSIEKAMIYIKASAYYEEESIKDHIPVKAGELYLSWTKYWIKNYVGGSK